MAELIKSVKGMHDLLPDKCAETRQLEDRLINLASKYGYQEIRTPLLEHLSLFLRSVGDTSDIVNKEMYSFTDQNNEVLALRPEGTAACVRAGLEHGLFYGKKQRLCYLGNMFRRERPQKGRYRQFSQFGIEAIGFADNYIEVEIISLISELFFGLKLETKLELNHLGSIATRKKYLLDLSKFLTSHKGDLDPDSQNRLDKNPLRILDSKNANTQKLLENAPMINDYLAPSEQDELNFIIDKLEKQNLTYCINPKLVRGLDYYTATVFEWQHAGLTICAGGRYDSLVSELGGQGQPAVGVALGIERLIEACDLVTASALNIAVLCNHGLAYTKALNLVNQLRQVTNTSVYFEFNPGKLKPLLKLANQNNCSFAVIIGENELNENVLNIKDMVNGKELEITSVDEFIKILEVNNV